MSEIIDFIYRYDGNQREVMMFLHHWFSEELGLTEKIRYNIPFYYGKSWICYLNPTKSGTVDLAFVRGNELSNSQGLLESKGRKQVYSVELNSLEEVPVKILEEIIQEAILLDESISYASKRNKR